MMKNDILQSGEKLIRVLALSESKAFVIDCKKQTMPYWTEKESLSEFKSISEAELQEILGCRFPDADELCGDEKRQIRETYSIIASVVPFADDETERKEMIKRASEKHGITAQTVRKYLCKYLVFQDLSFHYYLIILSYYHYLLSHKICIYISLSLGENYEIK